MIAHFTFIALLSPDGFFPRATVRPELDFRKNTVYLYKGKLANLNNSLN